MDKRYIQLYSLKDEAQKDFEGTLKRVAEIGYTGIEFASGFYGGNSAADLNRIMTGLGIEALGTHIVTEKVAEGLDFAAELGLKYIVDPFAHLYNYEDAKAFCQKLNEAGRLCKERGIVFGYHNHQHEFIEGKDGYLLETMLINTDPDLICFQFDVGWATYAGVDVPAFLRKYPARFKLIHVKECSKIMGPQVKSEKNEWNVASGKGIIDWPAVRDAAIIGGAEAFIIEREHVYGGDIFKCVEEDCAFLKTL